MGSSNWSLSHFLARDKSSTSSSKISDRRKVEACGRLNLDTRAKVNSHSASLLHTTNKYLTQPSFLHSKSLAVMFAEEIGGNTTRRKQEEQRRRRRQLKEQKQREANKAHTKPIPGKVEPTPVVPKFEPVHSISPESVENKPSAVSNALQLRAERQESQKYVNSARKIQSFYHAHRSNSRLLKEQSDALEKNLTDLKKLKLLLDEKASTGPYIFPPATATALCRKLLFISRTLPYKERAKLIKLRDTRATMKSLKLVLELLFLPGIRDKDEKSNPFLLWIQTLQGQMRLQNLLRLCLCVMTVSSDESITKTCSDFIFAVTLPSDNPNINPLVLRTFRTLLLPPAQPKFPDSTSPKKTSKKEPLFFYRIDYPLDIISALRQQLLFATGGSPIPSSSDISRESCIPPHERHIATFLFRTVLAVAEKTSDTTERDSLLGRVFAEIFSVPLLTWRVAASALLSLDHRHPTKPTVVSMIEICTRRFGDVLNAGTIHSILPNDVSISLCNATPAQCLLANLVQIGQASASLSGQTVAKFDFALASTFYEFIATLVDTIPLGTLETKDSIVEWFSDGKGHQTCVRLSPIVMEQCRVLISAGCVRRLFHCAVDQNVLKTKETLRAKNDRDLKHEKEFEEAGASAVSLAAKEARIDRSKSFWNSSSWARKVSSGVSKMLSSDSNGTKATGSTKKAKNDAQQSNASSSEEINSRTSYSPNLFLVLSRLFGIVLARWGGFGGEDIVRRVVNNPTKMTKRHALRTADVCSQSLLNVLCFSTPVTQATWGLIQANKALLSSTNAVANATKEKLPVRCLSIRPQYGIAKKDQTKTDAAALLFVFVSALAHTLIVTDDTEIHEMDKPLPLHQLRRCVETLKQLLYRACCVDDAENSSTSVFESNYFGLALINSSSRTMRDLYDRSSRRPICAPKLWLVEDLLEKEIRKSKTEDDYASLLKTPVLRMCPFLVSFKRRLKLFDRIIYKNRILIQGENSTNPFNTNPLKPGIPVRITRGRILEDGLITMNNLGTNMRQRISVQYHNEAGTRETGIDAGGLFKEFWTDLSAIAFDPNYALFRMTEGKQQTYSLVLPVDKLIHFCTER
eukprot:scaffold345_cov134-Cylindrotheca_fusiformis.AAC.94